MTAQPILDEFLELPAFAAEVRRHPRSVRRWIDEPNGLPYTSVGNRILIHVPSARAWLLGRMKNTGAKRISTPKRKSKPSGTSTASAGIRTHDAVPKRRRASRRPRAADAAATEAP